MKHTMLHMKLNSAVSVFAVAAAFSVLLPPSDAYCGICFLPDCGDDKLAGGGDINMNINEDSKYCENKGYTYYASGQCPQYQAQVGKCSRDDHYLKCDAVTWCKQNGYNTEKCDPPSFVDGQCPNGKLYYKQCKEDRPRACREAGYVNSCSPGRLYATTDRCQWDSSYGKCCTASPSDGCPSNYSVNCDASRGSSGTDTCGYTCYRCCDDTCPSGTSKNYTGSYASTTECGSRCNRCKDCTSGSTSYSGSYVGSSECGSCYSCSDTCSSGSRGGASCSSGYDEVYVGSTECGSSCYGCQTHIHSYSCPSGYSSSSSCSGRSKTAYRTCSCGARKTTKKCYKCIPVYSGGSDSGSESSGSGSGSGSGSSGESFSWSTGDYGFNCCGGSGFTCGSAAAASCPVCLSDYHVPDCSTKISECTSMGGTVRYWTDMYSDQGCKYGVGGSGGCADQFFICDR
ncbi:MAG: hypothetical protein SO314_07175 [Alphaproteobacteria bacterium]|nr:hypothetical protein [Alphaproteobacteria bacterium]